MTPAGPRRGFKYWSSRLGLSLASILLVFALLEGGVLLVFGPIYYPLPSLEDAAEYLYFTLPERFNPLFEPAESGDEAVFRTVPQLYEGDWFFAQEQSFRAQRGERGVRVAFMGGSSVQGWPFRMRGVVFAELVEEDLARRFPHLDIEVINAGVGTYSSFQLVDVADQLQAFNPDVVVVYAGHNDQGYYFFHRTFLDSVATSNPLEQLLNRFNFYQGARLVRDDWLGQSKPEHLGNADGVAFIPQDENIRDIGTARYSEFVRIQQDYLPQIFQANLSEVVDRLQDNDTQVVLAQPASNLRDFTPVFSMHWEPLSARKSKRFEALVAQADELMRERFVDPRRMPPIEGNGEAVDPNAEWGPIPPAEPPALGSSDAIAACKEPLDFLDQAIQLSDSHAMAHFLRGTCLIHSDPAAARTAFVLARDLSPAMAPFQRAPSPLINVVEKVATDKNLPVIDLPAAFDKASEGGIAEGRWFMDSIHFSAQGHRLVADSLLPVLAELPVFVRGPGNGRPADPSPEVTAALLRDKASRFTWGLDLVIPGAGMPAVGGDPQDEAAPSADEPAP
ncbi:MAG: hypothetical protein CL558_06170 [Alphaproteobacteria bacterium]|nr:hypothetical protein [Alphaproteobacteria bacterium]